MKEAAFWRDLANRFTSLRESHPCRGDLYATYEEAPISHYVEYLAHAGALASEHGAALEAEYYRAEAARVAEMATAGRTRWFAYTVAASNRNHCSSEDSRSLREQWRSLAAPGALGRGLTIESVSAEDAWLDLLRQRSLFFHAQNESRSVGDFSFRHVGGEIDQLCRASAELCLALEPEALALEQSRAKATSPTPVAAATPLDESKGEQAETRGVFRQAPDGLWQVTYAGRERVGLRTPSMCPTCERPSNLPRSTLTR
jgi:hypothetical protein